VVIPALLWRDLQTEIGVEMAERLLVDRRALKDDLVARWKRLQQHGGCDYTRWNELAEMIDLSIRPVLNVAVDLRPRTDVPSDDIAFRQREVVSRGHAIKLTGSLDLPVTDHAIEAVIESGQVASNYGHCIVSVEHLLLALLRNEDSAAVQILRQLGIAPAKVQHAIDAIISRRQLSGLPRGFCSEAIRIIEFACQEAHRLGSPRIDTDHILLAVLEVNKNRTATILANLGLRSDAIRQEIRYRSL
jgi:Clp amino terminal domain, pathogenicity island component